MLVVPVLLAGLGVERIDVIERGRHVHDAVDDDRRRLQRLLHFRLENPGRMQLADIRGVDLLAGEVARLIVVAVGVQEVGAVAGRRAELLLRHCRRRRARYRLGGGVLDFLSTGRAYRSARNRRSVHGAGEARSCHLHCFLPVPLARARPHEGAALMASLSRNFSTLRLPHCLSTQGNLPVRIEKVMQATGLSSDLRCTVFRPPPCQRSHVKQRQKVSSAISNKPP